MTSESMKAAEGETPHEQRAEVDGQGEPSVLGAAATVAVQRKTREKRSDRRARRAARPRTPSAPAGPAAGVSARPAAAEDEVVHVFEPHSKQLPPLKEYFRALWARRRFMVEMAKADIRGSRSSTVLGSVWGVLDPLFQAGIYYLLFTIIRQGSRPLDFLHVLIAGIFLFQLATTALNEGGSSIRQSKGLMLNSTFPRALLPIGAVYKGFLRFLPTIGIYAVVHLVLGAPFGWGLLLLPVLFSIQVVLMVGLVLLVSTIVVYVQDAKNLIQYVVRLLFFTTPVIYPVSLIPEEMRAILSWQPFFALFSSYQEIFDGGVPDALMVLQSAAWAAFFLAVGAWAFLRHERDFAIHL